MQDKKGSRNLAEVGRIFLFENYGIVLELFDDNSEAEQGAGRGVSKLLNPLLENCTNTPTVATSSANVVNGNCPPHTRQSQQKFSSSYWKFARYQVDHRGY